ncbi:MAG: hypothetical protein O3C57_01540 [Verrucomicrobia bacterium]|nr:hypothetical protein [Verrucomicrobiota bacterium]
MYHNLRRVYALSLLSGSLDSQLAVRVLQAQGIVVHGLFFESPFCDVSVARTAAVQLDVQLHIMPHAREIVPLLRVRVPGVADVTSPCLQNHVRMISRGLSFMREHDFHFLATGEVLDQKADSQCREALLQMENETGAGGLVGRPLCGKLLPETAPERNGLIRRDGLLDLSGRGHKRQRQMAKEMGIQEFPNPTGCCRLVDTSFLGRVDDLLANGGVDGARALAQLRYGRHFRLSPKTKLIVGRNEEDNLYLEGNADLYDLILKVEKVPGPTALLPGSADEREITLSAAICARYSDVPEGSKTSVKIRSSTELRRLLVSPATKEEIDQLRV